MNERGFYCVITRDRLDDLFKFLKYLLQYNNYPVYIAFADDMIDAYRKKTMIGFLSPFKSTVLIDTDIYVNGNLNYLFEIAEKGFIGIYRETTYPCLNSGVVAFPENIIKDLSSKWFSLYNRMIEKSLRRYKKVVSFAYDQDILNAIINDYPIHLLPREYNCILKEINPQFEADHWNEIKIFHFLHADPTDRKQFKCFRLYHNIENAQ
jgi:hypothetical protein